MNAPILYRHRTLSDYIKAFVKNRFKIIDMNEPSQQKKSKCHKELFG